MIQRLVLVFYTHIDISISRGMQKLAERRLRSFGCLATEKWNTNKAEISITTGVLTGHYSFNKNLQSIGIRDDPDWNFCGREADTGINLLFQIFIILINFCFYGHRIMVARTTKCGSSFTPPNSLKALFGWSDDTMKNSLSSHNNTLCYEITAGLTAILLFFC